MISVRGWRKAEAEVPAKCRPGLQDIFYTLINQQLLYSNIVEQHGGSSR